MHSREAKLQKLFSAMAAVESDLSLPLLTTLLAIAVKPGISINELADLIEAPQQTASRYVSILQGRYQPLGSSENFFAKDPLIEIGISADDPRKRAISLTANGKERIDQLLKSIFDGVA